MRTQSKRNSVGIALVDVLTVLICFATLVSLSLPMLIQMRSEARTDECTRRIKKICLCALNYHDSKKRLPSSHLGEVFADDAKAWSEDEDSDVFWKDNQLTSSLALVAPYMDDVDCTRRYDALPPICFDLYSDLTDYTDGAGIQLYEWVGSIEPSLDIMLEDVSLFLCPEDDLENLELPAIIATQPCMPFEVTMERSFDGVRDMAIELWPEEDKALGMTNYVACIGATGQAWGEDETELHGWRGAMATRHKITLEKISDGTSRTLMYGESLGEIFYGERKNAMSWMMGGAARVTGNIPFGGDPDDMSATLLGDSEHSSGVGFGSKHDDVVVVALCDGSCKALDRETDRQILYQLAGAWDGGTPEGF